MSRRPLSDRTAARIRWCHVVVVFLVGIALVSTFRGRLETAVVTLCLALLVAISASDAMRVILLYIRENRR